MPVLLRTWNADRSAEEWTRPQAGVFWGHCERCSDCCGEETCDSMDWVAYVGRFNLCATCERIGK